MSTTLVFIVIVLFFGMLLGVSYFTSRGANSETFFTGNRRSPWYLVAFGMIGSTISGVTFISVPGEVGHSAWTYLEFLFGNFLGYWVVALVLIPIYYRLKLVSIYTYLDQRFGVRSYKTGAFFFLISQTIGASFRLYLAAGVLQLAIFNSLGVPFWVTVLLTLFFIWLYTHAAGIKTVVWTDSLQTIFILGSVIITIWVILSQLNMNVSDMMSVIHHSPHSKIFDWDWKSKTNFFKQFIAGLGIVLAMNGLDQNMMQKNLTCKTQKEAQKNVFWFSFAFIIANLLFLSLGVLLYYYASQKGIQLPERTDDLFPILAMHYFGTFAGVLFLLGILSAAYSSADSALTALTTSFCIDFLNIKADSPNEKKTRFMVHIGFSFLLFLVIIFFRAVSNESVVMAVFQVAGYTYGPLLGLFAFGIITKRQIKDRYVPIIGLVSPLITYLINIYSVTWFDGYKFGFELLWLNAFITYVGLWLISNHTGRKGELLQ